MPHCKIYNPMMELTTVKAREIVCTYVFFTDSNRPTKTRRAWPLCARMRRGPKRNRYGRKNQVRREEGDTCHAVEARRVDGPKRSAEGAGGRAVHLPDDKREIKEHCLKEASATLDMDS